MTAASAVLMITIGIMVVYLVNVAFSGSGIWRGMFAVGAIPVLVIIIGALRVLPDSPAWLLTNGRVEQVRGVCSRAAGDRATTRLLQERQQERANEREQRGYVPETRDRDSPEINADLQNRFGRTAPAGEVSG